MTPTRMYYATMLWIAGAFENLVSRPSDDDDSDRGDVPGWVMITVMTAIVVIALLTVFKSQVTSAVKNAFDKVSGAGD